MAFVLVQHLYPKRKSALVELLATETEPTVLETRDGLVVEPDHVYIIPSNTALTIEHGILQISPRMAVDGLHMPIDHFFRSLAEDREDKAIGIVLSGTGTDGSAGLEVLIKSIKSTSESRPRYAFRSRRVCRRARRRKKVCASGSAFPKRAL